MFGARLADLHGPIALGAGILYADGLVRRARCALLDALALPRSALTRLLLQVQTNRHRRRRVSVVGGSRGVGPGLGASAATDEPGSRAGMTHNIIDVCIQTEDECIQSHAQTRAR